MNDKKNVFVIDPQFKTLKIKVPLGFPSIRTGTETDLVTDVRNRTYYTFQENKWMRIGYVQLLSMVVSLLESGQPDYMVKLTGAKLVKHAKDLLNKALLSEVNVIPKPKEPKFGEAFVFFNNKTLIVSSDTFVEYEPLPEFYNRTCLSLNTFKADDFNAFSNKQFELSVSYQWLKRFTNNDESFIAFIQEMFGVFLTPSAVTTCAYFLHGDSNTGKSTFISLIETLIGSENMCSVPLVGFKEQVFLETLEHNLVNASFDSAENLDRHTTKQIYGYLKTAISCESTTINPKHRNPFTIYPIAKHLFAVNDLPKFPYSTSFEKRFMVLPAVVSFASVQEKVQNKFSVNFNGERGLLVYWALKGLQRLLKNKSFTKSAVVEKTTADYFQALRSNSNPRELQNEKLWQNKIFQLLSLAYERTAEKQTKSIFTKEELISEVKKTYASEINALESEYNLQISRLDFVRILAKVSTLQEIRKNNKRYLRLSSKLKKDGA